MLGVALFVMWGANGGGESRVASTRSGPSGAVQLIHEPGAEQQPSSPQWRVVGEVSGPIVLESGDVVHFDAGQLPLGSDVQLALGLEFPSSNSDPRPVQLFANGRLAAELETESLEGDRTSAQLAIPGDMLRTPGRYIVMVGTTEKATFPTRRYAIEVH